MHEGSISIRLPADVREIARLGEMVRRFGELHGIPAPALFAVSLALDEVVTNVVLYGFDTAAGQEVAVRVGRVGDELQSEVVDGGREFDPLTVLAPDLAAALGERELGGLGIHLARSLMDRVDYRRENSKNVLTMGKRIH